jgi:predicted ATPase
MSTLTTEQQLAIVRRQLAKLETAVFDYDNVMERTTKDREQAYKAIMDAITTDFTTAIVCADNMTEEQRDRWLDGREQYLVSDEPAS